MAAKKRDNPIREFMPVNIDQWFGSAVVQAMKDFQRSWYMSLLLRAWQNVEKPCHLSVGDSRIWMKAGAASEKFWSEHCAIVMGEFETTEDGLWFCNRKQLELYEEKLASHLGRKHAGSLGGKQKSSNAVAMLENAVASPSYSSSESSKEKTTAFTTENFDGSSEFELLCQVYIKAERSLIASQMFERGIEWLVEHRGMTRTGASAFIRERAKQYCAKEKFQKGLTKWLEEKIFANDSLFKKPAQTKSAADEVKRQLEEDDDR